MSENKTGEKAPSDQKEKELSELFRGFSELAPIKRMGVLEKWAVGQELDSDARGRVVTALSVFFEKCPKNLHVAKKYAADVAKVVVLQKGIDKNARADLGRALRDFIEGSNNAEAAGEYVVQAVDIVAGVFNLDKTLEPHAGESHGSEPPRQVSGANPEGASPVVGQGPQPTDRRSLAGCEASPEGSSPEGSSPVMGQGPAALAGCGAEPHVASPIADQGRAAGASPVVGQGRASGTSPEGTNPVAGQGPQAADRRSLAGCEASPEGASLVMGQGPAALAGCGAEPHRGKPHGSEETQNGPFRVLKPSIRPRSVFSK